MAIAEIIANNIAANSIVNQLAGNRIEFINPNVRGAVVRLLMVASAIDMDLELFIGDRNPLIRGPLSVSATPNEIIDPDNLIIGGAGAFPSERLVLTSFETGGVATNDIRGRVVVRELTAGAS